MENDRRDFLKVAGTAALTTSLFTGRVKGANDKVRAGFIGMGKMGRANLIIAMKQENLEVASVCDVFERNLDWAVDLSRKQPAGASAKPVKDFRDILADKSIDVVCIATPDHWHAYMTVEACKAGKDVYVEKPVSVTIQESKLMVQAARKYNRVVQAGTMQRSGEHFQKATQIVKNGDLGQVTAVHTWNYGNTPVEALGNPADGPPPPTLDWDMWLGPAPQHEFNANRFGVDPKDKYFSSFRWFWDYAGGMMTDWGVHWLDIVQMAFDEQMPQSIAAMGEKFRLKDNRDTPDTLHVVYEYPGFIGTYENREGNKQSMFKKPGGILFCGDQATLYVDRSSYILVSEKPDAEPIEIKASNNSNMAHWANFLQCVKTREKPISDIEKCARSTSTCLLGNVALRSKLRLDWDEQRWTVNQAEARKYLSREARAPWKIVV
jgi:predicted dehydrogenase